MWYRSHRPRRWRGGFFFPFPFLIFLLVMNWGHLPVGILALLPPIIVLLAFGAMFRKRVWGYYQQPYQNNQPPYYNQSPNTNQYYQQQPYTPYQQGYQQTQKAEQPRETYQEGGRSRTYPQQEQYQEYEQPQAQYPEQMPPMQ
jgi:hypothetical protein